MIKDDDYRFYKTLIESTLAIPWKIDWITKEFVYVGPQIENLLGWTQSSWKTAQDWIDRMHPDDRKSTATYCVNLSEQGIDHEADYRALKSDGSTVWIRDVVHVLKENENTIALIGFMFDISERKKLELKLEEANKINQELLRTDSLTKIANRKAFDERIEMEFKRSLRNNKPLSILFIDIDHFKAYNDYYGHLKGDDCLVEVSQIINNLFRRPADLAARFGGEEFIVLLPETSSADAIWLGNRCVSEIRNARIPHENSVSEPYVTVSIGVYTMDQVNKHSDISSFLNKADDLLYQAKSEGRNRIMH